MAISKPCSKPSANSSNRLSGRGEKLDSSMNRLTSLMRSIPHSSFRIAGLLFLFSLCAPSVSSAEPGHSYIGYQLGYESTQGDVTGKRPFCRPSRRVWFSGAPLGDPARRTGSVMDWGVGHGRTEGQDLESTGFFQRR